MKKSALVLLALASIISQAQAASAPRLQCTRNITDSQGNITQVDAEANTIATLGYNSVKKRFVGSIDQIGMSASPGDSYCSYAIPAIEARYFSDLASADQGSVEIMIGNGEAGKTSRITGFISKKRTIELAFPLEAIPFDHDPGEADPACKDTLVVTCSLVR